MPSTLNCQVLIHGGSFVFLLERERVTHYEQSLTKIIQQLDSFVSSSWETGNLTAIDIVEYAVQLLESDPLYNAGKGSVFSFAGTHVMEASIMDGISQACGAASLIENVEHPISLARVVMEHTVHNYIAGKDSTEALARKHGLSVVEENSFFSTERRMEQYQATIQTNKILEKKATISSKEPELPTAADVLSNSRKGTVGCVVYFNGEVAAGTSTGGMTNKHPGRIGDSPLIGCGTYAEHNCCAVSFTGTGEEIMRRVGSYDIACRIKYGKQIIHDAVRQTLFEYMPADTAGVIAIDGIGNGTMQWNTKGMLRGSLSLKSVNETFESTGELRVLKKGSIGVYDEEIPVDL